MHVYNTGPCDLQKWAEQKGPLKSAPKESIRETFSFLESFYKKCTFTAFNKTCLSIDLIIIEVILEEKLLQITQVIF